MMESHETSRKSNGASRGQQVFFRLDDNRDGYITQSDLAKALAQRVDPLGTADEAPGSAKLTGMVPAPRVL